MEPTLAIAVPICTLYKDIKSHMITRWLQPFAGILLVLFLTGSALAAPAINTLEKTGLFGSYDATEIAVRGYDTVAYFTEARPATGSADHTLQWQGATWQFASADNQALFEADPEKYAPQYGGYCAYGVAGGYLVKIEPENWTILEGKLYVNYSDNVQSQWEKNIPEYIQKANVNFEQLIESD
ncbi:MAG: YHS domain-containing protein [bacterium]